MCNNAKMLPGNPKKIKALERARAMRRRFLTGETLQEIGNDYNITKQRVQHILSREFNIRGTDGGVSERARKVAQAREERSHMKKYGMLPAEFKLVQQNQDSAGISPWTRYIHQRNHAKHRNIEWNITFTEWWTVWEQSGKWSERGVGHGYCMARYNDTGAYKINNVSIITGDENSSEFLTRYWKQIKNGERSFFKTRRGDC